MNANVETTSVVLYLTDDAIIQDTEHGLPIEL